MVLCDGNSGPVTDKPNTLTGYRRRLVINAASYCREVAIYEETKFSLQDVGEESKHRSSANGRGPNGYSAGHIWLPFEEFRHIQLSISWSRTEHEGRIRVPMEGFFFFETASVLLGSEYTSIKPYISTFARNTIWTPAIVALKGSPLHVLFSTFGCRSSSVIVSLASHVWLDGTLTIAWDPINSNDWVPKL